MSFKEEYKRWLAYEICDNEIKEELQSIQEMCIRDSSKPNVLRS